MSRVIHFRTRAQRSDPDRNLPAIADLKISLQPGVGAMHDLVNRKWRCRLIRVLLIVAIQFFGDLFQPGLQHDRIPLAFASVEGWKRSNNPSLTLRNDELGHGNDEQR